MIENIDWYLICKYFHIIFMTTWMAGLFYLPRIFVYHSKVKINSNQYKTFIIMERKLLKIIMNPSMILTWIFGLLLVINQKIYDQTWFQLKFIFVVLISIFHMYCARIRKLFENDKNCKNEKFFRYINEIPTILFFVIVYLVVFQPLS